MDHGAESRFTPTRCGRFSDASYILTAAAMAARQAVLLLMGIPDLLERDGIREAAWWRLASAIGILGAALTGSHLFFLSGSRAADSDLAGCWLLSLVPSIGYRFVLARTARRSVPPAVTMFVGKYVTDHVSSNARRYGAIRHTREDVTILFTDIRGFTAFCQIRIPRASSICLNEYSARW